MELLTGEPLALDLVNTVTPEGDALDSPDAWLALQAGRLTPGPDPLTAAGAAALRALREHVRAALEAVRQGEPLPAEAAGAINEAARAAPSYRVLLPDLRTQTRRDGGSALLAQLADAAIDLLGGPDASRVRACEGPGCRMLFLPAHPRRRWCSPALCGNRVRVARYYQRHKSD